jgi:hypothetical protein
LFSDRRGLRGIPARRAPRPSATRRDTLGALVVSLCALAGCDLGADLVSPVETPIVVLHAVLTPDGFGQSLLLERAWDGRHNVLFGLPSTTPPFQFEYDPANPIVSGGGIPELLADIDITTPSGVTVKAMEPRTPSGESTGGGQYFVPLGGMVIAAGGRFAVHVKTTSGRELFASTTVPHFLPSVPLLPVAFDRIRDTLQIRWNSVPGARAYQVVIESVFANVRLFTESTFVRLTGEIRNVNAEGLPRTFIPGFQQRVAVLAVDSNYYDYYRTSSSSLTGTGIVSRVEGGIGIFGAAIPIARRRLDVTGTFRLPPEGAYRYLGSAADSIRTLIVGLTLNVLGDPSSSRVAVSGSYRARPLAVFPVFTDTAGAFLGERWRDSLVLAFLSRQRLRDTIDVFRARIAGDTLIGSYRWRTGTWRFLRTG